MANKGIKSLWGYPLIDEKGRSAIDSVRSNLENNFQKKTDDTLGTTDKTVPGAINEIKNNIDNIGDNFTSEKTETKYDMKYNGKSIGSISIGLEEDQIAGGDGSFNIDLTPYQTKNDDTLTTTNKTIIGGINEIKNDIIGNKDTLTTTNKTNIVSSINEVDAQCKDIANKNNDNYMNNLNLMMYLNQYDYICAKPIKTMSAFYKPIITSSPNGEPTISNGYKYTAWPQPDNTMNTIFTYVGGDSNITAAKPTFPYYTLAKCDILSGANVSPVTQVLFIYDGDEIEVLTNKYSHLYIVVDEGNGFESVTDGYIPLNQTNEFDYIKLKFPTSKQRVFKIYVELFGGVVVPNGKTITKFDKTKMLPILAFTGDSVTEGSHGDGWIHAYPKLIADSLGYDCINDGIGATGYVTNGSSGERVKIYDRLDKDVISTNPSIVVFNAGINDAGAEHLKELNSEVQKCIDKIKQSLPNCKLIMTSPFPPRTGWTDLYKTADVIKQKALSNNISYIDMINGVTYNENSKILTQGFGSWITGTSIDKKDGNCWMYISSDTTHPNQYGYNYIAKLMTIEIYKILNQDLLK